MSETVDRADLGPGPAGNFEVLEYRDGRLLISGWMLLPESGPFDEIRVLWNGHNMGSAERIPRFDVADALPWVERAQDSGFSTEFDLGGERRGRAEMIGYLGGRPMARHSILARPRSPEGPPLPPQELIERASGAPASIFEVVGMKAFTDLIDQVDRQVPEHQRIGSVLDWGCGCGRSTRLLLDADFGGKVHGCDIDAEAIAWCERELAPGRFAAIETAPPTPYPADSMDLIVGVSVFTHLSRHDQTAWLRELRRISSPGGLVVVSVHGEYAFRLVHGRQAAGAADSIRGRLRPMRRNLSLRRRGILDSTDDPALGGVAPSGYYRSTYQTRRYTVREFSEYFQILDYVERGLCGHQDLVVMRAA